MTDESNIIATAESLHNLRQAQWWRSPASTGWWLLLAIWTYGLGWIWQGFDLTDEGFHLCQQQLAATGSLHYRFNLWWLSDWLAGLWNSAAGSPSLRHARLGWVLGMGTCAVLAYLAVRRRFDPWRTLMIVVGSVVVITASRLMILSYNEIPALLGTAAAGLLILCGDGEHSPRVRHSAAIGAGFLLGLCVHAKCTYVLGAVLPVVQCVAIGCQQRRWPREQAWFMLLAFGGWCGGIALGLGLLAYLGRFHEYVGIFTGATDLGINRGDSLRILLWNYGLQVEFLVRAILPLVAATSLLVWAVESLRRWLQSPLARAVLFFWVLSLLSLAATWRLGIEPSLNLFRIVIPFVVILAGMVMCVGAILFSGSNETDKSMASPLAVACVFPLMAMAGSDGGFITAMHGLWLLLPFVVLQLPTAAEQLALRFKHRFLGQALSHYTFALFLAVVVYAVGVRWHSAYRDSASRFSLTAPFSDRALTGIHSTERRVISTDAVLAELRRRADPGDTVLAYNSTPSLNWLTATEPALDNPWPECLDDAVLSQRLGELGTTRPLPACAVRALIAPTVRTWMEEPANSPPWMNEKVVKIDNTLLRLGYRQVWANDGFQIFSRTE